MQEKVKVLLIEDDHELCESFGECFAETEGIELLATTDSAEQALEYVRLLQPDAVILDLELHLGEGNGIVFLSRLRKLRGIKQPYVLVNTNNSSQVTHEIVRKLGADFVMYKHTQGHSPAVIAEFLMIAVGRLRQSGRMDLTDESVVCENLSERNDLRKRILDELDKVSISPKRKGYNYLADAIEIYCGGSVANVSALIGEKYDKKAKSVERAMQTAIDEAWDNTDLEEQGKYYKARYSSRRMSPTVKEFIGYYASKLNKEN